jgi:succinate dehydrogenase hydrophobic anchor subunit
VCLPEITLNSNRYVLKWEISGIIFVFLLGALLHFVFEWSGESAFVGAIASVNESVWEHFKQGFWPMCLFAAIEYRFIRAEVNNFLFAKGTAVLLIPTITGLIFYSYTAIIGEEILIVDILIFALAVTIGQLVSYKIMMLRKLPGYSRNFGLALIVLVGLSLVLFTYFPPHWPIFLDKNTGTYGIP